VTFALLALHDPVDAARRTVLTVVVEAASKEPKKIFDFLSELGAASKVTGASTEAAGEVTAASGVEVAVKEPKQISTTSARMSAILDRKTTPDRTAMLHSEFLISPTWRANCQG
jgi:hypothetical protein